MGEVVTSVPVVQVQQALPQSESTNPLSYLVYGVVAFISPWLWGIGVIGGLVLAFVLPQE